MTETSAPWNGVVTGDAPTAPYDAPTEWATYWRSLSGASAIATNLGGVIRGELNALEATAPGAVSPAVVDTGAALCYGTAYYNSATVNVAVPTPGGATRIDRIVLRKDWAAQTVRIHLISGVEGGPAPSLTQIAGTTWDTPLCQASITTGAALTITDERDFIQSRQIAIAKAADETVNNSDVLQPDNDFHFSVGAGTVWIVRQVLKLSGNVTAGIKLGWDLPAGGSYTITGVALATGFTATDADTDNPISLTGAAYPLAIVDSVLTLAGTGGTAVFQWAQDTGTVVDTKVLAASTLVASQAT